MKRDKDQAEKIGDRRWESGRRMSVTGNNGKLWENAGISGKNWEAVIEKREIMGNSGKNWNGVSITFTR